MFENVGFKPPKSPKLLIFGINLPQRGIPLKHFLRNLVWGRESQVYTVTPIFTIVVLKMWAYGLKIAKNGNFWYKF